MLVTEIVTLDTVLGAHAVDLGKDFVPYRNHTYRVANLCAAHSTREAEPLEKIAIAAAFHDLGIWTELTFDYLAPPVALASAHLAATGRAAWTPEISEMILQHHKISPFRKEPHWLVESFRRADWTDISTGWVTFGLSRTLIRNIHAAWPAAGFHRRRVTFELRHIGGHPLKPLPMTRL